MFTTLGDHHGTSHEESILLYIIDDQITTLRSQPTGTRMHPFIVRRGALELKLLFDRPRTVSLDIAVSTLEVLYTLVRQNGARDFWSSIVCDGQKLALLRVLWPLGTNSTEVG